MNIKHYELVEVANEFLNNYNMKLSIPIEFNTRLKKVLGRFMFNRIKGECNPLKIEMSVDFMQSHPKDHIIDVFKHELVHYALCFNKLPFDDGGLLFEKELIKYGIKSTHSYQYLGELHKYTCINCGNSFERKRKLVKSAFCNCSKGPNLQYDGIIMKKIENMVAYQGPGSNMRDN